MRAFVEGKDTISEFGEREMGTEAQTYSSIFFLHHFWGRSTRACGEGGV